MPENNTETKPKGPYQTWLAGTKWRVVKEGGRLSGLTPAGPSAWRGWGQQLQVGDIITCDGIKNGFGSDPVPEAHFHNDASVEAHSGSTVFRPQVGMWQAWPVDGYLELITEED